MRKVRPSPYPVRVCVVSIAGGVATSMLRRLGLAPKLALLLLLVGVLPTLGIGWFGYTRSRSALEATTVNQLVAVRDIKKRQVTDYFRDRQLDAQVLAAAPATAQAIAAYQEAWKKAGVGGTEYLGVDDHYRPYLTTYQRKYGYYDLVLISPEGDVLFSVGKEHDLGTNLLSGPYKESGLAKAFREALTGKTSLQDFAPYAAANNQPAGFIATPVLTEAGQQAGVLAFQLSTELDFLHESAGMGDTEEAFLVGPDRLMRSDSRFSKTETILKRKVDTEAVAEALAGKTGSRLSTNADGVSVLTAYAPVALPGVTWAIIVEIHENEAFAASEEARLWVIGISLAVAAAALVLGILIVLSVTRPLRSLASRLTEVAAGNLNVPALPVFARDEIGRSATAFNHMVASLQQLIREVAASAETVAVSAAQLDSATAQVADTARGVAKSMDEVAHGAERQTEAIQGAGSVVYALQGTISRIAETAAEQSDTARNTTQVVDGMMKAIQDVSAKAVGVSASSQRAAETARQGSTVVEQASHSMERIRQTVLASARQIEALGRLSEEIGATTEVITEIAEQTNLLALNAAIEAARAGEHGRGFAVVAAEVRKLAERAGKSATQIAAVVGSIQKGTAEAVRAMELGTAEVEEGTRQAANAGTALGEIQSMVEQTRQDIGAITTSALELANAAKNVAQSVFDTLAASQANTMATADMSAGSQQVAGSFDAITRISETNAAAVEEVAASVTQIHGAAREMAASAQGLSQVARTLTTQVNHFRLS